MLGFRQVAYFILRVCGVYGITLAVPSGFLILWLVVNEGGDGKGTDGTDVGGMLGLHHYGRVHPVGLGYVIRRLQE